VPHATRLAERKPGKQPGAAGSNLPRREPNQTVGVEPAATCSGCGEDLAGARVVGREVRQVQEVRTAVHVVDYVVHRRRCACGKVNVAEFPAEARAHVSYGPGLRALATYLMGYQHGPVARTQALLSDVFGISISAGWLASLMPELSGNLAPFIDQLKAALGAEKVLCADETGTRVGLGRFWVHVVSNAALTLLVAHPKRGAEALFDMGVLPKFEGTVVHDGWKPYEQLDAATHAQCVVHLLRHLDALGTYPAHTGWTAAMRGLLLDAKAAVEEATAAGADRLDAAVLADYDARYHQIIAEAFGLLPPGMPPRPDNKAAVHRWSFEQRKAYNLARRFTDEADQVLRFLHDPAVPFDNNQAERDLRMVKLHDKISGAFRSPAGAKSFATVRSYLQTAGKQGANRLAVIQQAFTTGPWMPYQAGGT
jgi:transposase